MQQCENCKINIRDNKRTVLYVKTLPMNEDCQRVFPNIPIRYKRHLALKILIFISITIIVASFAVYIVYQ